MTAGNSSGEATTRVRIDWVAIAGLAIVVAGQIWSGASTSSADHAQTEDNTRRITVLEANDSKRADQLADIRTVTTRTETKLDILLDQKGVKQ